MTINGESQLPLGFKSVIKNAGITGSSSLIGQAANYVMVLVLTLSLGAEGFGLISLALVVKNIATLLGNFSLGITVLRFTAKYRGDMENLSIQMLIGTISVFVLIWSLLVALALGLAAPFLAERLFQKPELTKLFQIIVWMIPLDALFRIFVSGLHGLGFTDKRAYLEQLILPGSRLLLVVASLLVVQSVAITLWAMVAASWISVIISVIWLARRCRFWETLWCIPNDWIAWVKYAIPTFLDALLVTSLGGSVEILLLGIFGTEKLVGIYSVVLKLKAILNMPMMAFNNALAPMIGKLYAREELAHLKFLFGSATRWIMMLGLPLGAVYILFGNFLLGFFGESFRIGYMALVIVTLGQFMNILVGPVGHILLMTGYARIRLINSLILVIVILVFGLWLIPNWQLVGASVATAISTAIISIMGAIEVLVILKIHPYRRDLFKPWVAIILSMGIVGIIGGLSGNTNIWFSVILILAFGVCYLTALFGFGLNQADKTMFLQLIHKLRHCSSFRPPI